MSSDANDISLGEVSRGLARVEAEMREGFAAIRKEISTLSFVPAPVYAADMIAYRDRVQRLEQDLQAEVSQRRDAEAAAQQRAWQARWSIILAVIAMPISVLGSVVAGLLIASLK